jgi:hypothetical protein
MSESEIRVSERSVRRHAKKTEEEAAKAEEKARKLAEKKKNDPKKSKKEETEEKEVVVEKVECFGEELVPDFSVGKEAERKITELECLWDGTITYELQVCSLNYFLLILGGRINDHSPTPD